MIKQQHHRQYKQTPHPGLFHGRGGRLGLEWVGGWVQPPRVTFRLVVVPLRGPGRSPVLPFACCVGLLRSVGRCGRCSCWCRFRVHGAQWLVCWGCAECAACVCQRRPVVGVLRMFWLLPGSTPPPPPRQWC